MTRRALFVLFAACGPARGPGPVVPATGAKQAALVVVAPDAATFVRTFGLLTPVSGARLLVFGFGAGTVWTEPVLAANGVRTDAPLGGALTADGVVVRWARVADAQKLGAAFDLVPAATRWHADGNVMWRFGADELAVIAGDLAAVVVGGAPSRREQTALAIAAGELEITAPPKPSGLAIEVDGPFLIAATVAAPGPILTRIGDDLGRIRVGLTAAPEVIGVDVEVHPAAGSLAAELIAGANGSRMMTPEAPISLATRVTPAHGIELLAEIGKAAEVDVGELVHAIGRGPAVIDGAIALAPGAVSVRFSDVDTMLVVSRMVQGIVTERDHESGSITVGGVSGGVGAGGGIVIRPAAFGVAPAIAPEPPEIAAIADDNNDVPWSQDYKAARTALESAMDELETALGLRRAAITAAWFRWDQAFGSTGFAVPMFPRDGGYAGHGEWHPPKGTIAASVTKATDEFADLPHHDAAVARRHAEVATAREHALEIRAKDVQAWDNKRR